MLNLGCPGDGPEEDDPQLGPLEMNAPGRTPTMALAATSSAVDAADPLTALGSDQRWVLRPQGGGFDIGAYELAPPDTTAPVVTIAIDPADALAASGWYNVASSGTDGVLVHVSATDATSVQGITCLDGATTVLDVQVDAGSFSVGDGTHAITCSATDGLNPPGAAPGSTPMPLVLDVDQTVPSLSPTVTPNPVLLGASATAAPNATDATSGVASSSCEALDTQSPGVKSVNCQATDVAGNGASATADYTVSYRFFGFFEPIPQPSHKRGSTIPVKFGLGSANGSRLSDAAAQALLGPTCRVRVTLDGVAQPGCATYSPTRDTFQYDLKTSKSLAPGAHTVGIQVTAPDGSGVVNANSVSVVIRR
jgi:hypothetical protein